MWIRVSSQMLIVFILCLGFSAGEVNASTGLKSAYLGTSIWEEGLSSQQVNQQLRNHFAEVIVQLEARNASSLLTALMRAEASSARPWTKSDRRDALIYLAHNRQQQILRLHGYMNRGLFPLNEGQASSPVPIFVDRNQTHCAVGYLMHSDGKDREVVSVVNTNNLVHVASVREGGIVDWIRDSGLTQEEAAMIQPGYPVGLDANFQELAAAGSFVGKNNLVLSNVTVRGSRFNATTPTSFDGDPTALQAILQQGVAAIDANDIVTLGYRNTRGVLLGSDRLYLGPDDSIFGALVGGARDSGNVGIIEVEYQLRSERGNFSQFGLTSLAEPFFGQPNSVSGEGSALLILSQIFEDGTDDLLGETMLSVEGTGVPSSTNLTGLVGSDGIDLDTDAIRVRTYGLVVGGNANATDGPLRNFFHEFETSAVPEPSSFGLVLIFGVAGVLRRRRI